MRWSGRRLERGGSVGSITPFVLIALLALIPLAGLVIDGGRQLNGRARAIAYAQEAARAGAQALDLDEQRTRLLPDLADQLVRNYCADVQERDAQRASGAGLGSRIVSCAPLPDDERDQEGRSLSIGVEVVVEVDPLILDMFGAGPLQVKGRAVARAVTGIDEADEAAVPTTLPPTVVPNDPGDGGLPTVGPGEQTPVPPGVLPPCVTPPPTTATTPPPDDDGGGGNGGGGNGGGGNGGGGNGGGGNGGGNGGGQDDPSPTTPTPTTPTTPPTPPPNNDLDGDNAPDCELPPTQDPGGGDDADQGGDEGQP